MPLKLTLYLVDRVRMSVSRVGVRVGWTNVLAVLSAALLILSACKGREELPEASSDDYRAVVIDFYSAVARIQASQEEGAAERLLRATRFASGEPAIWYNLAVLAMRRNETDQAAAYLTRARETGFANSQILVLSGLIERERGNAAVGVEFLREAVQVDTNDVRALFTLARELAYQQPEGVTHRPDELLDRILRLRPDNTMAIVERMRLAAENGESERFGQLVAHLKSVTSGWPVEVQEQVQLLSRGFERKQALSELVSLVIRVGNLMKSVEAHRANLSELEVIRLDPGVAMTRFIRLPSPSDQPSPADTTLAFDRASLTGDSTQWGWLGSVFLSDQGPLASVAVNSRTVLIIPDIRLEYPGSQSDPSLPEHPVAFFDYDYDFRMDVAATGTGGVKIFRQESDGTLKDNSADVGLPRSITTTSYTGVWAIDIDLEGDMDLVLSTSRGPMQLLRNNGDGTFTGFPVFPEARHVRSLAWADMDGDGDPDAVLRDAAGAVHLFSNERSGLFTHEQLVDASPALAIDVTDFDGDGAFDVLALDASGNVRTTSWPAGRVQSRTLLPASATLEVTAEPEFARVVTADFDNNGGLDLLISTDRGSALWRQTSDRQLVLQTRFDDLRIFDAADLSATGNLNLVAVDHDGVAVHLVNRSQAGYLSRSILPRAAESLGDRRINSFGIGGEIELRADLLFQKRAITSPLVHFGLGDRELVDIARIIWPNGTSQAQFDLASDQTLIARQSLKGSCPWVFTNDGTGMRFVTDFIWRSPLGLRINAVETAGIATTEDWIKIDGDELAPSDGAYDVRITAELWETHFFDLVQLKAVDHPADTEIFVNEVFVFPPEKLTVYVTGELNPVRRAWDQSGRDVTDLVREEDGRHVDGFDLYSHQGRALDHHVDVDLDGAPASGRIWLIASGWIRPTDSSINVALGQGSHPSPKGIRVNVMGDDGSWRVIHEDLGFPSGKSKTMLIDLSGAFGDQQSRRVRLTTNLEIYWDALRWAEDRDNDLAQITSLTATTADLRYRGFSLVKVDSRSSPETPVYDSLASTGQIWRDLVGFYTRFGDVSELLDQIDDRYVIMNAGDELAMKFATIPPPLEGWERDFILVGDGWVKDGDYNTTFSKTVLPLPEHGVSEYETPMLTLRDNPAWQKHPDDWVDYHTRYVSTDAYVNALRLGK